MDKQYPYSQGTCSLGRANETVNNQHNESVNYVAVLEGNSGPGKSRAGNVGSGVVREEMLRSIQEHLSEKVRCERSLKEVTGRQAAMEEEALSTHQSLVSPNF